MSTLRSRRILVLFLLLNVVTLIAAQTPKVNSTSSWRTLNDEISFSGCTVSWLEDKHEFKAGDIARINIKLVDNFGNAVDVLPDGAAVWFTLSVNGTKGNSSLVSGVSLTFERNSTSWNITFIPILVGVFSVNISEDHAGISDSSLHFSVKAGPLYPSACVASWMDSVDELFAGLKVYILILPKDAFGNNVSPESEGSDSYNFTVSAFHKNGSVANLLDITSMGWNKLGYIGIEFIVATAGSLSLYVQYENQTLYGSPLPLFIKPGLLDMAKSFAWWKYGTNAIQIFSMLEIYIYLQDRFGNAVLDLYEFDAYVINKATHLSVPIADLSFQEVGEGIQLLSFIVDEPGNFTLTIFDSMQNGSISELSYDYIVFVGYCHGVKSVINGSGLADSVAGHTSYFSVYLEDIYSNPSPIEIERFRIQILRKNDSYNVHPNICSVPTADGPAAKVDYGLRSPVASSPTLSIDLNSTCGRHQMVETSTFNVSYTPEKSGSYEIWIFCGNIPLNDGHPFTKEVFPGKVDTAVSQVEFVSKLKNQVWNEIIVKLADSFLNPVPSQESKLSMVINASSNGNVERKPFEDIQNGSYVGYFLTKDTGNYEICVSYEDKHLAPCPFEVNVYRSDYFPEAYNDSFSVWEDESIAFDILANDYFSDGIHNILATSMPQYGTLLHYGRLFRYTPYKGFSGDDSFTYTISDVNHNIAVGTAFISVLGSPPRFVSLPLHFHAVEDVVTPGFCGLPGIEIKYSNLTESISVSLSTQSGAVFLAPVHMQFLQPLEFSSSGFGLAVKKERNGMELILVGPVEVINSALQLIQYLGNENFYGDDIITFYAMNKNGIRVAQVPVWVEPVNDPPYIQAPRRIILEKKRTEDGFRIFDKTIDTFEFSIGDPDALHFIDAKNKFTFALSLEVNVGSLIANLHSNVINTIEMKLEYGYQWQPLQSVVIISNHTIVRGKGVRFLGTIEDCNYVMKQLLYQGAASSAILTIRVNDMGNYGCHSDCTVSMSSPLLTEGTVTLIKRRPMSPFLASCLGSAIIMGFIATFILGIVLLFFTCKCAIALRNNRRNHYDVGQIELAREEKFDKPTSSRSSSENVTYVTGCSSPFLLRSQLLNVRQRSRRASISEGSSKEEYLSASQNPGPSHVSSSIDQ